MLIMSDFIHKQYHVEKKREQIQALCPWRCRIVALENWRKNRSNSAAEEAHKQRGNSSWWTKVKQQLQVIKWRNLRESYWSMVAQTITGTTKIQIIWDSTPEPVYHIFKTKVKFKHRIRQWRSWNQRGEATERTYTAETRQVKNPAILWTGPE